MGEIAYKFLSETGHSPVREFAWPLPNGKPGKWVKAEGVLRECKNGIHAVEAGLPMLWWLNSPALYEIELSGEITIGKDKIVARRGRLIRQVTTWNEKNQRLFAADCAAHVLPIFEKQFPKDKRPREAIRIARAYARGKATADQLAAARDAAGAAAWAAAGAAAWAAAGAAARDAARDAAWAAAGDAAGDAAWAAERRWQAKRLLKYLELT